VAAGHKLRLTATYDNSLPHARVMGIELIYIAPGAAAGCTPVPPLQLDLGRPGPPPLVKQPLGRIPAGRARVASTSYVSAYRFSRSRVIVRRGTRFRWLFRGVDLHNVTLANGPIGFSSPNLRAGSFSFKFTRPGTYNLYCSLHPVAMTQIVVVR
jgi:plastocyanin